MARSSFKIPVHTTEAQKATARPGVRHRRSEEPQKAANVVSSAGLK